MHESLFPADDIWEKFDIPPMSLYSDIPTYVDLDDVSRVVPSVVTRHDCMWAGTCSSEQHQKRECCNEPEPVVAVSVSVMPPIKSGRSVLRTSRVRARTLSPRPETPSESEEEESPISVGGVCEDFAMVVPVAEVTGQVNRIINSDVKCYSPPSSPSPAFHSDHCYHLNKTSTVALENLGVQTPSDSEEEEEIDVVSVADREKLTTLPTNPSAKDKQQLQRTVATAIQQRRARNRKRPVVTTPPSAGEPPQQRRRRGSSARLEADVADTCDKRNQHNNMERLRRIDLRDSISRLRKIVPTVAKNERAPKVQVLKEATKFITYLHSTNRSLVRMRARMVEEQERLTTRLKELRRDRAKERGTVMEGDVPPPKGKKRRHGSSDLRRRKNNNGDEEWMLGTSRKKQRFA